MEADLTQNASYNNTCKTNSVDYKPIILTNAIDMVYQIKCFIIRGTWSVLCLWPLLQKAIVDPKVKCYVTLHLQNI